MFRRTVHSPDGRKWRLGRRWLPRRVKLKKADLGDAGGSFPDLDLGGDDLGIVGAIFAAIGAIFLAIFLALLLFNVIALAIELTILIVALVAGLLSRVVFRRPWVVEARSGELRHAFPVVGYLRSRRVIRELETQLASGAQLDPAAWDRA